MSKRTASRARGRRRAIAALEATGVVRRLGGGRATPVPPRQGESEAAAVASVPPSGATAAIAGQEARPEVAQPGGADGGTRRAAARPRGTRQQSTAPAERGAVDAAAGPEEDVAPPTKGTRAAPATGRQATRRPRDPRLGIYSGIGALFNRALQAHGLDSAAVRRIAGLAPHEPNEALLDLPDGLDGVWRSVEAHVIGEGMRAG
ncbi:MAG: hypothetical protein AB7L91_06455 [Dehalococcoidia bacterium]